MPDADHIWCLCGLMFFTPQPLQDLARRLQRDTRLRRGRAGDDPVVRVPGTRVDNCFTPLFLATLIFSETATAADCGNF